MIRRQVTLKSAQQTIAQRMRMMEKRYKMRRSRLIGRSFKLDAETENLLSSDSDEEDCWEERRKQGKTRFTDKRSK
jgi:hypothetical protein